MFQGRPSAVSRKGPALWSAKRPVIFAVTGGQSTFTDAPQRWTSVDSSLTFCQNADHGEDAHPHSLV